MICHFCDIDHEEIDNDGTNQRKIKNGATIKIAVYDDRDRAAVIVYNLCNNCRETLAKVIPAQILSHNLRKNYHGKNPDYRVQRKNLHEGSGRW